MGPMGDVIRNPNPGVTSTFRNRWKLLTLGTWVHTWPPSTNGTYWRRLGRNGSRIRNSALNTNNALPPSGCVRVVVEFGSLSTYVVVVAAWVWATVSTLNCPVPTR